MTLRAADLSGRVTFITGPEKGSGKTTLLNYSLALLRAAGEAPAFLSVGFDGEASEADERATRIDCRSGEVFVSAERFLRKASCLPELLEALPGSTALGRLAVVRARRDGQAVLVGPERNEYSAFAIDAIRAGQWARTILVDGAMNRITQVSSFRGARFYFAARVSPGDLDRNVRAMARMCLLARLPEAGEGGLPEPAFRLSGPLTEQTLARVPRDARTIVIEDFTKVFLDPQSLSALSSARALAVEQGIGFGGFVVSLRDVSRERFAKALRAIADRLSPTACRDIEDLVAYDPFEAEYA